MDLPDPLGPTMQVMPGSSFIVVAEAKDLKPFRVRLLTYTSSGSSGRATGSVSLPARGFVTAAISGDAADRNDRDMIFPEAIGFGQTPLMTPLRVRYDADADAA
ncbi:hypothetical protein GCM10022376_20350 [Yimella lutea]